MDDSDFDVEALEKKIKDAEERNKKLKAAIDSDFKVNPGEEGLGNLKVKELEDAINAELKKESIVDDRLLSLRTDPFLQFLKLSIGTCGDFELSDCFVAMPDDFATSFEEYKQFLKPFFFSALVELEVRLNQLLTPKKVSIQQFTEIFPLDIRLMAAQLVGVYITRSQVRNTFRTLPTKSLTTEMTSREGKALLQLAWIIKAKRLI